VTFPKKLLVIGGVAGLVAGAAAGGFALASSNPTVKSSANAALGERIVVDGHGRTLYELRPETSHHFLCHKADSCFGAWPPLTVASKHAKLTAGHGVHGKLAVVHHDGVWQVTLAGHPLYRFAGDSSAGDAGGQGIQSFGGTWHVVSLGAATPNSAPTDTTAPDTTPADTTPAKTTPYCLYPGYC